MRNLLRLFPAAELRVLSRHLVRLGNAESACPKEGG